MCIVVSPHCQEADHNIPTRAQWFRYSIQPSLSSHQTAGTCALCRNSSLSGRFQRGPGQSHLLLRTLPVGLALSGSHEPANRLCNLRSRPLLDRNGRLDGAGRRGALGWLMAGLKASPSARVLAHGWAQNITQCTGAGSWLRSKHHPVHGFNTLQGPYVPSRRINQQLGNYSAFASNSSINVYSSRLEQQQHSNTRVPGAYSPSITSSTAPHTSVLHRTWSIVPHPAANFRTFKHRPAPGLTRTDG